jgi:ABC-type Fe3+-hydroxamate transport system substrate-binding protein
MLFYKHIANTGALLTKSPNAEKLLAKYQETLSDSILTVDACQPL